MSKRKINLSTIAMIVIVLTCMLIDNSLRKWKHSTEVIEDDIVNYYEYLPLIFIYDDIKIEHIPYKSETGELIPIWYLPTKDGKNVIKMTMGLSILYSPFFFIGHGAAHLFDYPATGYSLPYKLLLLISTIVYLVIGLVYLRKILRHYGFSDYIIAVTIFLLGTGTNLLCYASQSAPMPHVYLFCLFAIFIYYTIKWYESPTIKRSVIIGFTTGLISLIRPTDAVIVLFFIFYGITSFAELKERILFLLKKINLVLLMVIPAFIVWIPQFLYWKTVTGDFICYSYNQEKFFFNSPKIIEGLFSYRKGWLLYTPLMAFALAGLFFMKDELKKQRFNIILFFLINIYIVFSWWCWWYGGSYGMRSMIDGYALYALPLAAFIKYLSDRKIFVKIAFSCLGLFFIWLNIYQTYQYEYGGIHYDGMNKFLYFKTFNRLHFDNRLQRYITTINYEEAMRGNNGIDQHLPMILDVQKKINLALIAYNDKYVCADEKFIEIYMLANRDYHGKWESFTLTKLEGDKVALQSHSGRFVVVDLEARNVLTANEGAISPRGSFTLVKNPDKSISFIASNGKYVTINKITFQLVADSDDLVPEAKFTMVDAE